MHLTVSGGPGQASVPSVKGLGRRAAAKKLTQLGFKVNETEQSDDTVPHDHVIDTQPPAGTPLDRGSTVTLLVSTGPSRSDVPNEVGKTRRRAQRPRERRLQGLRHSARSRRPGPRTPCCPRIRPAASTHKGSTVTLTVAKQPSSATVPDETGKQDTDAVSALQDAGFKVDITRQDTQNLDEDGIVLTPGSRQRHGQEGLDRQDRRRALQPGTCRATAGRRRPTTTPTTP